MELQVLMSQLCRVCQNQDLNREETFCQILDDILPNTQVAFFQVFTPGVFELAPGIEHHGQFDGLW